jgi:LPS export ABC transporter protein LptC
MMMTRWMTMLFPALLAFCCACSGPEQTDAGTEAEQLDLPEQVIVKSETYLTESGRRTSVITSDTAKVYQGRDITLLYRVELNFYDSSGASILTLTADSGRVTKNSSVFEATGDVRVRTEDGKRLETDSLRWDATTGKVTTEGYVEAYRGEDKISGWGLETDQSLENVIIKRNSKGSFAQPQTHGN